MDDETFICINGEWENNHFKNGKVCYTNGDTFNGTWKTGNGKMEYENKESYDGEWLNHKKHGHGKMKTK